MKTLEIGKWGPMGRHFLKIDKRGLIETLKLLWLKTIKKEMAKLGVRVKNVLVVAGEASVDFLREPSRAVVEPK
ncbi:hypothetical protein AAC387_Pa06g1609 [Persea americana]